MPETVNHATLAPDATATTGQASAVAPATSGGQPGLSAEAKPTETAIQALSFGEVIRQLRMMQTDLEYFRNVVSLGSHRTLRIAALEKAGRIVERAQREHHERRKLDRR